ncbi:hypothetical protein [Paenibacillus sp. 1001270B_150601_E10]|uniref:hypothetical protein n=1 Tax=Paenibacillus sp. 1001270B_150601_E10 TaxID=2787079 RepID=UPI00189D9392|nr:hypothetical protein [Paenibacillus sp. 1001270B_150601_E10]
MGVVNMMLGLATIGLAIFTIKNPHSWLFKRLGDDSEPSNACLQSIRFRGKLLVAIGVFACLMATQFFLAE